MPAPAPSGCEWASTLGQRRLSLEERRLELGSPSDALCRAVTVGQCAGAEEAHRSVWGAGVSRSGWTVGRSLGEISSRFAGRQFGQRSGGQLQFSAGHKCRVSSWRWRVKSGFVFGAKKWAKGEQEEEEARDKKRQIFGPRRSNKGSQLISANLANRQKALQ